MGLIPLYFQVERKLREKLRSGEIVRENGILPSEEQLCRLFDVSRITVRKALGELALEGLIVRRPGKGTFLVPRRKPIISQLFGNIEGLFMHGARTRMKLLHQNLIDPTPEIRQKLNLDDEKRLFHYQGLRYLGKEPYSAFSVYLPNHIGKFLTAADLKGNQTIFKSIEEATGVRMVEVDQVITASTAGEETAKALKMKPGDPILLVERVYFSQERKPVELAISYFQPELYQYRIKLIRGKYTP